MLILAQFTPLVSQNPISGVILNDKNGEPISFVSVAVMGKPIGTVSNQNGVFNLSTYDLEERDSVGFFYMGFENLILSSGELSGEMTIRLREQPVEMEEVSVTARRMSGGELIKLALEKREINYNQEWQYRTVFKRNNSATWVDQFNLQLEKSNLKEIDERFVQTMEDSMIRYSRSYADYLYRLYNSPDDSAHSLGKIQGIKRIELNEEIGGEMEQIANQFSQIFTPGKGEFWKLRTGLISARLNDPNDEIDVNAPSTLTADQIQDRVDSITTVGQRQLYNFDQAPWNLEFLQQPNRYSWQTQGIMPVRGERCYVVDFKGRPGKDYTGKLYISEDSYAILRIDYELMARKAEHGIKLLGITYNEPDDSGIVLFERDENGYFLKYQMHSTAQLFAIDRSFELIQKTNSSLINKRLHKIDFDLTMLGRNESCEEVLVISRNSLNEAEFKAIQPRRIKTDKINHYSDDLWQGYPILEPTKQMKDYRARVR